MSREIPLHLARESEPVSAQKASYLGTPLGARGGAGLSDHLAPEPEEEAALGSTELH